MYAAAISSVLAAGLVTAGVLAPNQQDSQPSGRVVTSICAGPSYAPASPEVRAACAGTYTSYGLTSR